MPPLPLSNKRLQRARGKEEASLRRARPASGGWQEEIPPPHASSMQRVLGSRGPAENENKNAN